MTKEEKIVKLRELGVWEKWDNNISSLHGNTFKEYVLNYNEGWEDFITSSFNFRHTPEGLDFWEEISNKEI